MSKVKTAIEDTKQYKALIEKREAALKEFGEKLAVQRKTKKGKDKAPSSLAKVYTSLLSETGLDKANENYAALKKELYGPKEEKKVEYLDTPEGGVVEVPVE